MRSYKILFQKFPKLLKPHFVEKYPNKPLTFMIHKITNHRTKKNTNHLIQVFRTVSILSTKSIKELNKLEKP